VDLKDPALAALLAFLVPGLGHFYQRRVFKGLLYCVCILGTFFTGLRIGHGQVVYFQWKPPDNRTYAYLCQFWVGAPALPALAQSWLRSKPDFDTNYVTDTISQSFEGTLYTLAGAKSDVIGELTGRIELQPDSKGHWIGTVSGTLTTPDGGSRPIKGKIVRGDRGGLDPQVAPWPQRRIVGRLEGQLVDGQRGAPVDETVIGRLEGTMPRSIWDSFEAPLQDPQSNAFASEPSDLDRAHRELGGRFELGVVYTMIAGLLNILAVYDAFEGPAYEDEEEETQTDKPPPEPNVPPPS
jgi:hypothetical protein